MESTATMVELGGDQWSSFDGVSVNEEADFMAQLFPNPSLTNQLEISSSTSFLALSSSSFYDTNTSFYSSDDTNDSNLYSNFSQDSSTNYSGNNVYPCHENYYMNNPNQFLAANPTSLPIDFFLTGANSANLEQSVGDLTHHGVPIPDMNLQLKPEYDISETDPAADDKNSDSSDNPRKRSRVSDNKGKRKVRSKKNQGIGSDEEDDDPTPNRHNSSSCSSEEDNINGCQEMRLKESAPHNSNAKTRASRGSATDPQSLYARKRRERINERLKILQSLVPNGTKVDISTMLEEAVHYVKFLQLQIKLLSSDEMWMYAPLAYNGMDIGDALNTMINRTR